MVAARPVLSSHSANRGMPRILVSMEASFFPSLFSRWMERLAVSRTEATCPGASSRRLPQLLMYHMELSWNTNKVRLRPASSIHTPSSMNGIPIRVQTNVEPASKGGVPATITAVSIITRESTHWMLPNTATIFRSRTMTIGCCISSGSLCRQNSSIRPNPRRISNSTTPVHTPAISSGSFPSGIKISGSRNRTKAMVIPPEIIQGHLLPGAGRSQAGSSGCCGALYSLWMGSSSGACSKTFPQCGHWGTYSISEERPFPPIGKGWPQEGQTQYF